eukprot:scaffold3928_cov257-Pinguiococcus_pyrenoidosus.AAC.14
MANYSCDKWSVARAEVRACSCDPRCAGAYASPTRPPFAPLHWHLSKNGTLKIECRREGKITLEPEDIRGDGRTIQAFKSCLSLLIVLRNSQYPEERNPHTQHGVDNLEAGVEVDRGTKQRVDDVR